jgi:hypothetical protein
MVKYLLEKREAYGKYYLKVKLQDNYQLEIVQHLLTSLKSVKKVNITKNERTDLTLYSAIFYDVEDMMEEVEMQLESFYSSRPFDPVFEDDALYSISQKAYNQIIEKILIFGLNLEKLYSLKSKLDEEGFRDFFLPHLNSISISHSATGETFNKIGKTDILIQNGTGENIFIAECKIWHGESEFLKAIDQLLQRYITWRDEYTALIIFSKNKNFSDVIASATEAITKHSHFDKFVKESHQSSFSYLFKNSEDESKKVKIELILFNCA